MPIKPVMYPASLHCLRPIIPQASAESIIVMPLTLSLRSYSRPVRHSPPPHRQIFFDSDRFRIRGDLTWENVVKSNTSSKKRYLDGMALCGIVLCGVQCGVV